ncbi:MAG: hypothetical protein Q7S54_00745, partial [bacterium]|nr:hypothetical protein [bacterium]
NLKEVGIATAVGMYQGRETTFVVQMFGTPARTVERNIIKISSTPPDTEEKIAGAQSESLSAVERAITSPKESAVNLYSLFIAFVALLMFMAAVFEFRRHHKGIWLSGGLLITVALILIALTLQSRGVVI